MRDRVLIFDFGNVVGYFDYLRACERFAGGLTMTASAFRDLIEERGFPRLLAEFESGRIAPEVFASRVMEMSGVRLSYEEFVRAWEDIFWPNEAVAHLIASLKSSGYAIYLGSNTNLLHATHYRRQFAQTLDLLDGFILSHEVGHLKPGRVLRRVREGRGRARVFVHLHRRPRRECRRCANGGPRGPALCGHADLGRRPRTRGGRGRRG